VLRAFDRKNTKVGGRMCERRAVVEAHAGAQRVKASGVVYPVRTARGRHEQSCCRASKACRDLLREESGEPSFCEEGYGRLRIAMRVQPQGLGAGALR